MKIKVIRKGNWENGIPDSLTLPCAICGKVVNFDFEVEDKLWNNLVPEHHRRGVLCLKCFDMLAYKQDIDVSKYLKKIYYCGIHKTIKLKPEIVYKW